MWVSELDFYTVRMLECYTHKTELRNQIEMQFLKRSKPHLAFVICSNLISHHFAEFRCSTVALSTLEAFGI